MLRPTVVRSIKLLLFDWDGTVVDSAHLGLAAFQKVFTELDVPFSDEIYEANYSPNWYLIYEALRLPESLWQRADSLWRLHYDQQTADLVAGAADTLIELKRRGYRLGIVTSGNEDRVTREVEQASLGRIFDVIVCAEHIVNRKPHPEGLECALRRLDCECECAAYVGDAPEDIQMGKRAGTFTVGVHSNYPSSHRLLEVEPDLYLESIAQLTDHFF